MDLRAALGRTRLVAAAACFLLGAVVLIAGVVLPGRQQAPPAAIEPAFDLDLTLAAPADPCLSAPACAVAPTELVVYISGAVLRPDVYRLVPGARVKDAVLAAGGLAPDAAADQVNLAAPLSDADHVHIPAAGPSAPANVAPAASSASGPAFIDLNRAGPAELEELPGVGATLAARIVERRTVEGPFTAVEELREVTGIGEKLYGQIAPLVTVGP